MTGLVDSSLIQLIVQAGALGLLAPVLYFILRWWIRKSDDEFLARVEHDKIEQQCRSERDQFIEGLVKASQEQQAEQMKSWQDMTTTTLRTFQEYTTVLQGLTESHRESRRALAEADHRIDKVSSGLVIDVQKMTVALDNLERAINAK